MLETEKRMRQVCFSGHRPEKLTRDVQAIQADLEQQIRRAVADGLDGFITGMARGVDIWAAQIVLRLRSEGMALRLICACPYEGFEAHWRRDWQRQYRQILEAADCVQYISPHYHRGCFQIRNRWMVDHAARVIAVYNGTPGGTKNTIDYAERVGVCVQHIAG